MGINSLNVGVNIDCAILILKMIDLDPDIIALDLAPNELNHSLQGLL